MGQKFAAFVAVGMPPAFYDAVDSPVPASVSGAFEITGEQWLAAISTPGYTVVDGALVAPTPPTAAQLAAQALIQSAQSMLAAGLAIVSTSTPALSGTYACDQLSQMDIIAVETSVSAGKGFPPGGATTFNYPDVTGVMHSFSETNFTDFAAAIRDYVYALKSVIAGASTILPAASTTLA
jgi:hypothetical protein